MRELVATGRALGLASVSLARHVAGDHYARAALAVAGEQVAHRASEKRARRVLWRTRLSRPRRLGYDEWRTEVTRALDAAGAHGKAVRWDACGRVAWVRDCTKCGTESAHVEMRASCQGRGCPVCERRASKERQNKLVAAALRVPGYVDTRQADAEAELRADETKERHAADYWASLALRALDPEAAAKLTAKADAAEIRRKKATAQRHLVAAARGRGYDGSGSEAELRAQKRRERERAIAARESELSQRAWDAATDATLRGARQAEIDGHTMRGHRHAKQAARHSARAAQELVRTPGWSWKLVTFSPPWRPWEASELSPERLRERAADVMDRWRRVWESLASAGGLAGASTHVELSSGGHVHLHALFYGPFLRSERWTELAGCFVDVREIEVDARDVREVGYAHALEGAIREAAKYATKVVSPTRWEWVGGKRWRVMHPELVAAWAIGTHGMRLANLYGTLRDAWEAEEACGEEAAEPAACHCRACGFDLTSLVQVPRSAREIARALGAEWAHALRVVRGDSS